MVTGMPLVQIDRQSATRAILAANHSAALFLASAMTL